MLVLESHGTWRLRSATASHRGEAPDPFPGLPGPAEAPHGPCCFPLIGLPETMVGGWVDGWMGELRGGGEVLKLGQDALPK